MKHLAIVTACFLAAAAAKGDVPLPRNNLDCGYCVALELDRLAALLGDPVLKDMVCRLAFDPYTPRSLSSALHIPREQVRRRIDTLRDWGLVRAVSRNPAGTIVEPLPGNGADTLRRWALRYCPLGNGCGEPGPDADIPKDTSVRDAAGPVGGRYPIRTDDDSEETQKFAQALGWIDAVNNADPTKITRAGRDWAREAVASERRSHWVHELSPNADPLVHIAARAMHIARWEIPRADFPEGRIGYRQWRIALAKFHAQKTGEILAGIGYTNDQIDRVKDLIQKKNLKSDPVAQLLEDVANLVFFEYDLDAFATTQSEAKLVAIIKRTWRKMSAQGRESVRGLKLSKSSMKLVDAALKNEGDVNY